MNAPNFPPYKKRPITDLVPYGKNSRTHTDEQIAQVAASIQEFGFTNPVLIDAKGQIIAGHCRVLAAKRLGMVDVPTLTLSHLTDAQKRAYVIADNKLALNAGWDDELLRAEFTALGDEGFDLSLIGFSEAEISAMATAWSSDIEAINGAGEHLEGIKATLKIRVEQEASDIALETIEAALAAAGIEYSID